MGDKPPKHKRAPAAVPQAGETLTEEQIQFAELYLHTGNVHAAYRQTHNCEGLTTGTAKFRALSLLQSHPIRDYIHTKRAQAKDKYTVEDHLQEIEQLRQLALEDGNLHVASKMTELRGKVMGYHNETINHNLSGEVTTVRKIQIQLVKP